MGSITSDVFGFNICAHRYVYLKMETTVKWEKNIKNQRRKSPLDKTELSVTTNHFFSCLVLLNENELPPHDFRRN